MAKKLYWSEEQLREEFGYIEPKHVTLKEKVKKSVQCNGRCVAKFIFSLFPILDWLPKYSKFDIFGDLIGGITTAIIRIPQSLAYGLLAGVAPINGMYTGFFAPLTYAFLGTSKHVSVGTFAVVSLMLGAALEKYLLQFPFVPSNSTVPTQYTVLSTSMFTTGSTTTGASMSTESGVDGYDEFALYKLSIISSLTLLIGCVQILLGSLNLGFVAIFLSDPLVAGFTTGSAIFVFTAQIKYCFGISLQRQQPPFAIMKTYVELFNRLDETVPAEVIISVISVVILYPFKIINQKYKEKFHNIPIPIELIVVIIATIVSTFVDLSLYNVEIVGKIPKGLPPPVVPDIKLWPRLISDSFSIAVVGFAITVSVGKLFAKKHGYSISPNQELFALGISQFSCGIFQGHACSGALARSVVKESSGTRTQASDFVSCAVILLVLLFIGPLLSPLPIACLSCIIMVNIRSLFLQFTQLPRLWRLCKYDFTVWVVTFTAVVTLGVDLGLFAGVGCLLLTVVLRIYAPAITFRGAIGDTTLYKDLEKYQQAQLIDGIRIIRFSQSPFFGNKAKLLALCTETIEIKRKCDRNVASSMVSEQRVGLLEPESTDSDHIGAELPRNGSSGRVDQVVVMDAGTGNVRFGETEENVVDVGNRSCVNFHTVVLDCSGWTFIDIVGMEAVKQVCKELRELKLTVYLAALQPDILDRLVKVGVTRSKVTPENEDEEMLALSFPSVHFAVEAAKERNENSTAVL